MRSRVFAALAGMLVFASVEAYQVPPAGATWYIQTSGPEVPLSEGDWYTSNAAGNGFHFVEIFVPVNWPGTAIHIDLLSPDLNSSATGAAAVPRDTIRTSAMLTTRFEVHGPYDLQQQVVNVADPTTPLPGTGLASSHQSYGPNTVTNGQWVRHYTISSPNAGRKYLLRTVTEGDHDNGWAVRVGTDNDSDPNNAPPANSDNPDGVLGTNDELIAGILAASIEHSQATNLTIDLFEHVEAELDQIVLHNFDMDSVGSIFYTDAFGIPRGTPTISGNAVWNNGSTTRGGDVLINPLPGLWRIRTTINGGNQFIQEGRSTESAFAPTPPEPRINMAMTGPATFVQPGTPFPYTVSYIAQRLPNPGTARNLRFSVFLPPDTLYVPNSLVFASGKVQGSDFTVTTNPPTARVGQEIVIMVFAPLAPDESDAFTFMAVTDESVPVGTNLAAASLVDYLDAYNFRYRSSAAEATVLAVDLHSFTARLDTNSNQYIVDWITAAEFDNVGFHVYSADIDSDGQFVPGERLTAQIISAEGNETSGAEYSFADPRPVTDGNAMRVYYLQDVDLNGTVTFNGPVATTNRALFTGVEDWMALEK